MQSDSSNSLLLPYNFYLSLTAYAASSVILLPVLILTFLVQRFMVAG